LDEKEIYVNLLEGRELPSIPKNPQVFIGLPHLDDQLIEKKSVIQNLAEEDHYFISSKYSIATLNTEKQYGSIYSAGIKTMRELSRLGFWVNATSDSLGIEESMKIFNSRACKIMLNQSQKFINLTNAASSNSDIPTITTYERQIKSTNKDFDLKIEKTDVFYWTSFFQYQTYVEKYPSLKNKIHACGLGHTLKQFQTNKISVVPFSKMEEFKQWTSK
jgi:hydroxymethylbilane synthase